MRDDPAPKSRRDSLYSSTRVEEEPCRSNNLVAIEESRSSNVCRWVSSLLHQIGVVVPYRTRLIIRAAVSGYSDISFVGAHSYMKPVEGEVQPGLWMSNILRNRKATLIPYLRSMSSMILPTCAKRMREFMFDGVSVVSGLRIRR